MAASEARTRVGDFSGALAMLEQISNRSFRVALLRELAEAMPRSRRRAQASLAARDAAKP
jgi:hypothetical protein